MFVVVCKKCGEEKNFITHIIDAMCDCEDIEKHGLYHKNHHEFVGELKNK